MPRINAIDIAVGRRLRIKRIQARVSAQDMAGRLHMPIDLLKAFEAGRIRVGADHLFEIARILKVSPRHFLEDVARDAQQIAAVRDEHRLAANPLTRRQPA